MVKEVHVVPEPGNGVKPVEVAIIEGQYSIVTAPADTDPLPVTRNLTVLDSSKNCVNPSPVVAAI